MDQHARKALERGHQGLMKLLAFGERLAELPAAVTPFACLMSLCCESFSIGLCGLLADARVFLGENDSFRIIVH